MENIELTNAVAAALARFGGYVDDCRGKILSGLATGPHGDLLCQYFARGKMFRAMLVFLATSAVGGDPAEVMMAAEAIELCHGASLIHDDIIDGAAERRSLPALHRQKGEPTAIVLGDYLLLRAFAVLTEAQAHFGLGHVLAAIRLVSRFGQECCRGQIDELETADVAATQAAYLAIVEKKTATLFAAAVTVGPTLLGRSAAEIESLKVYGLNLGIAYQIFDDVLDLVGDPGDMGKPVGNSLAQGRPMLPLIYLAGAGPALADRQSVVGLLREEGIFERVRRIQEHHIATALAALDEIPVTRDVATLRAFAGYAANWLTPSPEEVPAHDWSSLGADRAAQPRA